MQKTVTILGSTGSVGSNTLRVIREHPAEFCVAGLAAGSQSALLKEQIEEFRPRAVFLKDTEAAAGLSGEFAGRLEIFTEKEGLSAFSAWADADILMAASSGTSALLPVIGALEAGKRVALANKELLVVAGGLVMACAARNPAASLIPVDSEHSAIFQCLRGANRENVERLILTGTGGPLREIPENAFLSITKETVVNHPKWKMGPKISVDSATLMNKGLEIIEASWLFGVPVDRIDVLIHPEAVIHSMVEFKDGVVLAQLGVTDMRLPIRYALGFPQRLESPSTMRLDWKALPPLTFAQPNAGKFPCLGLALEAARRAGSAPCVLSAADEVAVGAYLEDKIDFVQIPRVIEQVLSNHRHVPDPGLDEIRSIHAWALEETRKVVES